MTFSISTKAGRNQAMTSKNAWTWRFLRGARPTSEPWRWALHLVTPRANKHVFLPPYEAQRLAGHGCTGPRYAHRQ